MPKKKGKNEKRTERHPRRGTSAVNRGLDKKNTETEPSNLLLFSGVVAFLAIGLWQYFHVTSVPKQKQSIHTNSSLSALFRIACKKTKLAYCAKGVFDINDETRTIRTKSDLHKNKNQPLLKRGDKFLEIPRSLQITTIDALRDPFVNNILRQNPRHPHSGKPLHPKAYLVLYLSLQLAQLRTNDTNSIDSLPPDQQVRRAWLEYLPTHPDFLQFHPLTHWNQTIDPLSPAPTLTDHEVEENYRLFLSEYQAISAVSNDFQKLVSWEDWITSRLIANTRSFSSDPLTESDIGNDELESYRPFLDDTKQESAAEDFYEKCRSNSLRSCMVPLLDAFDHNSKENIAYEFMDSSSSVSASKSFIAYAMRDIHPGSNLFNSYFRSKCDPLTFSQYGFVNDDDFNERGALLAVYHRHLNEDFENDQTWLSSHRTISRDDQLKKYLSFKDGYEHCDYSNHDVERQTFEMAKLKALKAISNSMTPWVAILPPRNDESIGKLEGIMSMCRMLALTHRDYEGQATEVLQIVTASEHPHKLGLPVSRDSATWEGLEYRANHVLERLATEMRSRAIASIASLLQMDEVPVETLRQKLDSLELSSWERSSVLARLGEWETLTILVKHAAETKTRIISEGERNGANGNAEDFIVRTIPCPE